jgi:hypothetical protein
VVVLYPLEVKRRLVTVDTAMGRAVKLTRGSIRRRYYQPPDLDRLAPTVEVTRLNLRPFAEVAWTLEEGTKVWPVGAEQPLRFGWRGDDRCLLRDDGED